MMWQTEIEGGRRQLQEEPRAVVRIILMGVGTVRVRCLGIVSSLSHELTQIGSEGSKLNMRVLSRSDGLGERTGIYSRQASHIEEKGHGPRMKRGELERGSVMTISVPCHSPGVSLALLVVLEGLHAPRKLSFTTGA